MFYFTFTFYKNDSCCYNIIAETNTQPQTNANDRKQPQTNANNRNEQQNHRK